MKYLKRDRNRKKDFKWVTVKCDTCKCSCDNTSCDEPYVMLVDRDEIKTRPSGYKGKIQLYAICDKCGKAVTIPETSVPKSVWNYIWEKAYKSGNCFEF